MIKKFKEYIKNVGKNSIVTIDNKIAGDMKKLMKDYTVFQIDSDFRKMDDTKKANIVSSLERYLQRTNDAEIKKLLTVITN